MSETFRRVHYPECNVWCNERGHWLLASGPVGAPFSHQDPPPRWHPAECAAQGHDPADHADPGDVAGEDSGDE